MKAYILLVICCFALIGPQTNSGLAVDKEYTLLTNYLPVTQKLNLLINGTGGVWVNVTKHYDYILAMTLHLEFTSTTLNFDEFGGDVALTNGFAYYYNNINMLDSDFIQTNHEFGDEDGSLTIFVDATAPKHYSFYVNVIFADQWVPNGLYMTNTSTFGFLIQDDMPTETSVEILNASIRGYEIIQTQVYNPGNQFDPLDWLTSFLRDNYTSIIGIGLFGIGAAIFWRFWKRRM